MKTRLWICEKCGYISRRYLNDGPRRLHCGESMRAARAFPPSSWYRKFELKARRAQAEREALRKKYSRTWNSEGRILSVSKETRQAYRDLRDLQRGGSYFISRATKLLLALRKDLGRFGSGGVPQVRFADVPGCRGHYARSLMRGIWEIALTPGRTLPEFLATFLHETLHWIDDQASCGSNFGRLPHDHFQFEERLADLTKRLEGKL